MYLPGHGRSMQGAIENHMEKTGNLATWQPGYIVVSRRVGVRVGVPIASHRIQKNTTTSLTQALFYLYLSSACRSVFSL